MRLISLTLLATLFIGHVTARADLTAEKAALVKRVEKWEISQAEIEKFFADRKADANLKMPSHWTGSDQDFQDFNAAIGDEEVSQEAGIGGPRYSGLIHKVLAHPQVARVTETIINTLADKHSMAAFNLKVLMQTDRTRIGRMLIAQALDRLRAKQETGPDQLESMLEQSLRDASEKEIIWSLSQQSSQSLVNCAERTLRFRHEPIFFQYIEYHFASEEFWSRLSALDMIGTRRDEKTLEFLKRAVNDDPHGGIRRQALNILSAWQTSESREIIKNASTSHKNAGTKQDALDLIEEDAKCESQVGVDKATLNFLRNVQ